MTYKTLAVGLIWAGTAMADGLSTGFEPAQGYAGSPVGILLTGQQGWYLPVSGSEDFNVFWYGQNIHGFAVNPGGGEQFTVGRFGIGPARAQIDVDFSGPALWRISYDVNSRWTGASSASNNLGSFSLQPSGDTRSFIALNRFDSTSAPTGWMAGYNVFDAQGGSVSTQEPGPGWEGLAFNRWYRQSVLIDLDENRIVEVAITDLATGARSVQRPAGWYLRGGASPTISRPSGLRLFAAGNSANIVGWDNLVIVPEAACYPDCDGSGALDFFDFLCFQNAFLAGDPYADCDGSGALDFFDFLCFQNEFLAGCP